MVNVSTLFYVLENLEDQRNETIDLDEIYQLEQKYLKGLFGLVDRENLEVNPAVVKKILQTAGTH
jgi:hypothetical protein